MDSTLGFYITDELTGTRFLVDTGAFCSIYPTYHHERHIIDTDHLCLAAANGSSITSHGTKDIKLRFIGHTYSWSFRLAQVTQPLLGADFFGTPSPPGRRRRSEATGYRLLFYNASIYQPCNSYHRVFSRQLPVQTLIAEYSDVFKPELHQQRNSPAKHGIHHHITTSGASMYSHFRRLNPEKLAAAKTSFTEMERMGICSKDSSPWASPLHMVHKSDGNWRPCGDYRRLNLITEPDHYPMPNIADFTNSIGTARVFSKLDLLKGYFQVPVYPADVPKTAIITPFGSYVFHYSTFGLRNSGATFQRMMD